MNECLDESDEKNLDLSRYLLYVFFIFLHYIISKLLTHDKSSFDFFKLYQAYQTN